MKSGFVKALLEIHALFIFAGAHEISDIICSRRIRIIRTLIFFSDHPCALLYGFIGRQHYIT